MFIELTQKSSYWIVITYSVILEKSLLNKCYNNFDHSIENEQIQNVFCKEIKVFFKELNLEEEGKRRNKNGF